MKTKIYLCGKEIGTNETNAWEISNDKLIELLKVINTTDGDIFVGVLGPNGNRPVLFSNILIQKTLIENARIDERIGGAQSLANLYQ